MLNSLIKVWTLRISGLHGITVVFQNGTAVVIIPAMEGAAEVCTSYHILGFIQGIL